MDMSVAGGTLCSDFEALVGNVDLKILLCFTFMVTGNVLNESKTY